MWLIALNCVVVVNLAVWGPINETFRAKFVLLRGEHGEEWVLTRTRALLAITLLVAVLLVAVMVVFPYRIAELLAPAYGPKQLDALVVMLWVVAPSLLFDQFSQLGTSILNAYDSFFVPEISNCIAALVNIVSMVLLAPHIGIYALAVSYYIGLILMLSLITWQIYMRKIPIMFSFRGINLSDFKPFFVYALPFFVPYFFIQINVLVEKSLGSLLGEGVVSMLDYSRKFVDIPINVLTSVLLTMLVPILSGHFAKRNTTGFMKDFKQLYQFGLLVVTALIGFFCSSSTELIKLILYHKGQITQTAIAEMGRLSVYYAWSALVSFLYIIFGLALLATNKGKIYAFFGVLAQLIMIGLNFLYYRTFGAYTFPLTFIIAHAFSAVALFLYFPFNRRVLFYISARYILYLGSVVTVGLLLTGLVHDLDNAFLQLVVNGIIILLVMLALLFILQLEERLFIRHYWFRAITLIYKIKSKNEE